MNCLHIINKRKKDNKTYDDVVDEYINFVNDCE